MSTVGEWKDEEQEVQEQVDKNHRRGWRDQDTKEKELSDNRERCKFARATSPSVSVLDHGHSKKGFPEHCATTKLPACVGKSHCE